MKTPTLSTISPTTAPETVTPKAAATVPSPVTLTTDPTPDRRASDASTEQVDRRQPAAIDRRSGLERRRGPGRRRCDSRRSAEEGEMNPEQFEFVMAMDEYKRTNKRPFPSWTEVLEVIKYLGYRKVAEMGEHINRPSEK